jgi:uncharacterized tellurite resistance protein B-like protein
VLKALSDFLERSLAGGRDQPTAPADQRRHGVQLATALLLVEVARADYSEDITEHAETFRLVQQFFELSEEEARLLIQEARQEADHAASLQAFTRMLHEKLSFDEKHRIVEMLWQVALADDRLDKHEDHLVRKISDLLYVSHSDLIRIRNRVKEGTAT